MKDKILLEQCIKHLSTWGNQLTVEDLDEQAIEIVRTRKHNNGEVLPIHMDDREECLLGELNKWSNTYSNEKKGNCIECFEIDKKLADSTYMTMRVFLTKVIEHINSGEHIE